MTGKQPTHTNREGTKKIGAARRLIRFLHSVSRTLKSR
jgi:hypothetical protein